MNNNQKVAVYKDGILTIGTLKSLFPNVSFPTTGPNADWIVDNNVYRIKTKAFTNTQKSIMVEPYFEAGSVYTNMVIDKTKKEIADELVAILNENKEYKKTAVMLKYSQLVTIGFIYEGNTYQIDDQAQGNMVATQARFNKGKANSHGGYWRDKDNVKHTMDDAAVQLLFDAAFQYKSDLIRHMHDLKDVIDATRDESELAAVDINAGWPANQ